MNYTYTAGYQKTDTSKEAADQIEKTSAKTLRHQVENLLKEHPNGLSTEQISQQLNREYVSVQPRTSELRNTGAIIDSGNRVLNKFRKRVIVWQHSNFIKDAR